VLARDQQLQIQPLQIAQGVIVGLECAQKRSVGMEKIAEVAQERTGCAERPNVHSVII